MNKKAVISNVIVSVIVNLLFAGILIGAGALVLAFPQIFGVVLSAAFALIGISLVLITIKQSRYFYHVFFLEIFFNMEALGEYEFLCGFTIVSRILPAI